MPRATDIRVAPRNLRWEVSAAGITRPLIDWLCTKERAIEHARERALEMEADAVIVERDDGSIESVVPTVERRRRDDRTDEPVNPTALECDSHRPRP